MGKQKVNKNSKVTGFIDALHHPKRVEIELLRNYILSANNLLTENIKWNGPNYCFNNEDRITMRIQPIGKQIQLIFHRGAIKKEQPENKLIPNKSKMLIWKENDRAIVSFNSLQEIENAKEELKKILMDWINATK